MAAVLLVTRSTSSGVSRLRGVSQASQLLYHFHGLHANRSGLRVALRTLSAVHSLPWYPARAVSHADAGPCPTLSWRRNRQLTSVAALGQLLEEPDQLVLGPEVDLDPAPLALPDDADAGAERERSRSSAARV